METLFEFGTVVGSPTHFYDMSPKLAHLSLGGGEASYISCIAILKHLSSKSQMTVNVDRNFCHAASICARVVLNLAIAQSLLQLDFVCVFVILCIFYYFVYLFICGSFICGWVVLNLVAAQVSVAPEALETCIL